MFVTQQSTSPSSSTKKSKAEPQLFDFRRPKKFSREHLRALQIVHETFSRSFATLLATTLRTAAQMKVLSVQQKTFDEHAMSVPNPSYLTILSTSPLPGRQVLQLPLPFTMSLIDRMLGGNGNGPHPVRALTDIESGLVKSIIGRGLSLLDEAFESLLTIEAKIVSEETNIQFAGIAAPSDSMAVITFDMRLGDELALGTICYPFTSLAPILEATGNSSLAPGAPRAIAETARHQLNERMRDIGVEVAVQFNPVTLTADEILDVQVGDVIPLHHRLDQPLTLFSESVEQLLVMPGRKGRRIAAQIVGTVEHQ
jgi:flagellar motor switch protein FliM